MENKETKRKTKEDWDSLFSSWPDLDKKPKKKEENFFKILLEGVLVFFAFKFYGIWGAAILAFFIDPLFNIIDQQNRKNS